jgi:hypothetical protein
MSASTSAERFRWYATICVVLWFWLAHAVFANPRSVRQDFVSPEEAAAALATAARSHDTAALRSIFGPGGEKLLLSGDRHADEEQQRRFTVAYDEKHELVPEGPERVTLHVGNDDWPLPIPIVQRGRWHRWSFDTESELEAIIRGRVDRNELAAIRVALGYGAAQKDYFERMKQQSGTGFYAERVISTSGRRDGLYWTTPAGTLESSSGPLATQAVGVGYPDANVRGKPMAYQGYYFRVLRAQGSNASGGAINYVKSRRMTDGFALIAWPAIYGLTGVRTFQVGQDGVVFQKDLGAGTSRAASRVTRYDPDMTWVRSEVPSQ